MQVNSYFKRILKCVLTVCVPQNIKRLNFISVKFNVVPEQLNINISAVLRHPITRNLSDIRNMKGGWMDNGWVGRWLDGWMDE